MAIFLGVDHLSASEPLDLRYEQLLRHISAREQVGREEAERLAVAVVDALRSRLSAGEADDVEAELPPPLQRLLRRADRGHSARHRGRHDGPLISEPEFLQALAGRLGEPLDRADTIARVVFGALRLILSPKEIADVATQLGAELRQRWLGHPAPPPIKTSAPATPLEPEDQGNEALMADLRSSRLLGELSPEEATRAVLGLFLHRVSGGEAHRILDELPPVVRELLGPEAPGREAQVAVFGRQELVRWVSSRLGLDEARADTVIRAVFAAARLHCSEEQAARVAGQLPYSLRTLWFRPAVPPLVSPEDFLDERLDRILGQVRRALDCDEATAWRVSAQVLCQLEHRLSGGEGAQLLEELPWRLRELMQVCRPRRGEPPVAGSLRSFVEGVASRLELDHAGAEAATRAVFGAVRSAISEGEARAVSGQLPGELKALWWGRTD